MARICDICGRSPLKGKSRSHSNVATLRRQFLNLQTKTINGKKKKICTGCLKTLLKEKKSK
ncbi:50S ribosomal protein L28 [Candidatus Parcubacteria bacterium]|nr:MAG: 50S ribosomal protein L28 [Candidatus Parcubacteria bacterium]